MSTYIAQIFETISFGFMSAIIGFASALLAYSMYRLVRRFVDWLRDGHGY